MADATSNDQAELNRLRSCPNVAWPTVLLFVLCTGVIGSVWYAAIAKGFSLWLGAIINGAAAYYLFSVVHDSSHNAVSKNKFLNELLGRVGIVYFAPLAPTKVAALGNVIEAHAEDFMRLFTHGLGKARAGVELEIGGSVIWCRSQMMRI